MSERSADETAGHWFVWIDLRARQVEAGLYDDIVALCADLPIATFGNRKQPPRNRKAHNLFSACRITDVSAIAHALDKYSPRFVFFEFDYPDSLSLRTLQHTKQLYPSLPIVMLTEHHSEALAVWAFRSRVWDYLVKPLNRHDILNSIAALFEFTDHINRSSRANFFPPPLIPIEARLSLLHEKKLTGPAVSYIESHFQQDIKLSTLADLCKLSAFHFSRVFKKENGMTFIKFLQKYRVARAAEFFVNSRSSVSDVGFVVGFNNLSYFDRVFRKHMGLSPSQYLTRFSSRAQNSLICRAK